MLDAYSKACILKTPVVVKLNKIPTVNMGKDEKLIKWNEWAWKFARIL